MTILEWVYDWEEAERGWIGCYRRANPGKILNVADGGLDMRHAYRKQSNERAVAYGERLLRQMGTFDEWYMRGSKAPDGCSIIWYECLKEDIQECVALARAA